MQKILTICLPTYNRDWCVEQQLARLQKIDSSLLEKIEIIISDNGSTDKTQHIIEEAITQGFPCIYQRHPQNLGSDGNFLSCFQRVQGKYVWLLGDDDFIRPDALNSLIQILEGDEDYGLLYIDTKIKTGKCQKVVYTQTDNFMKKISYMFSFISSNILQSKYLKNVNGQTYIGSLLLQVPFYLTSMFAEKKNAIIKLQLYDAAKDNANNGGYNLFKIFIESYLTILQEFIQKGLLSKSTYQWLKKDLLNNFLIIYIDNLLIKKKLCNFNTENAWHLLNQYYGKEWYYYTLPFRWFRLNLKYLFKRL